MATYARYENVVLDKNGKPVPGATVTVQVQPGLTLATIYSTALGTSLNNPLTSDSAGNYFFYAAPGVYTVVVSDAGITYTSTDVSLTSVAADGTWTGTQTFNGPVNVGSASMLDPAGLAIGNRVVSSTSDLQGNSVSAYQISTGDYAIPNVFRLGLNPIANSTALQMGISEEGWISAANTKTFSGAQTGVYGSFSHFGSGTANAIYGGSFEGFNSGPATVTQVCGVNGNAWCGGVAAGQPVQTPTNNGSAANLRGVQAHVANLSSGTVTAAQGVYVNSAANTGGGSITTALGVDVADQTAGSTNFALRTGLGAVKFNDIVNITGHSNLPTGTSGSIYVGGSYGSPIVGKLYVGDGSGWQFVMAKRTASADTDLFKFLDSGVADINTGIRINGAATTANVLRGNGTNFVSAQLAASDLSNGVTGSGAAVLATAPTISGLVSDTHKLTAVAPTVAAGQVGLGATTATSATAGTNGAVPAQVLGYLIINVAGTSAKVPYFNT